MLAPAHLQEGSLTVILMECFTLGINLETAVSLVMRVRNIHKESMVRHTIEVVNLHAQVFQSLFFRLLTHGIQSLEFLFNGLAFRDEFIQPQIAVPVLIDQPHPICLVCLGNSVYTFSLAVHIAHLIQLQTCNVGNKLPQFFLGCLVVSCAYGGRRGGEAHIIRCHAVCHQHTPYKHGNLCRTCS